MKLHQQVNANDLEKFLRYVVEGEQDKAEAMLKQNAALALVSGNVTDLSDRAFQEITGFQYAAWALDWHMWTMVKKYLPDDAAREQIQSIETKAWAQEHGNSASWQNLLDALQKFEDLCKQYNYSEADKWWQKEVGKAQRLLPVHVVNEYCHPTRPFDPCPDFNSTIPLPRSRATDEGEWFTARYKNGWFSGTNGKLGETFAFVRASLNSPGVGRARLSTLLIGGRVGGAPRDYQACNTLLMCRRHQRNELIRELGLQHSQLLIDEIITQNSFDENQYTQTALHNTVNSQQTFFKQASKKIIDSQEKTNDRSERSCIII